MRLGERNPIERKFGKQKCQCDEWESTPRFQIQATPDCSFQLRLNLIKLCR